ncbi:MAG: HigA family addiction module antitoxin [Candidatus Eremiobacteraeota bacterium]|nr:HigA family addiction module antitoxin [Candidatus Eremiobacteraeota bacterium]
MKKAIATIHPGEILLEDFMKPHGLSANRLAMELRVPATRITAIINGERAISVDTALRLSRYFGTSADVWLGLQTDYELRKARIDIEPSINREVHELAHT